MMPPMSPLSITIVALLAAIIVAVLIGAWYHDFRMEYFRVNVKPGQMVTYYRLYYSRTEQDSEYGKGIVYRVEEDDVVVIKPDMSKITVHRKDLYPA